LAQVANVREIEPAKERRFADTGRPSNQHFGAADFGQSFIC
jgi:hypothetical protein